VKHGKGVRLDRILRRSAWIGKRPRTAKKQDRAQNTPKGLEFPHEEEQGQHNQCIRSLDRTGGRTAIHSIELFTEGGGRARLVRSAHVKTKNIIIAHRLGSSHCCRGMKPDTRILTNIEILSLNAIPKSLIVIGSRPLWAPNSLPLYNSFGSDVTLLEVFGPFGPGGRC